MLLGLVLVRGGRIVPYGACLLPCLVAVWAAVVGLQAPASLGASVGQAITPPTSRPVTPGRIPTSCLEVVQ